MQQRGSHSTGRGTFHPVHLHHPSEIIKAFHGAGRTGRINLFGLSGYIINYVNGSDPAWRDGSEFRLAGLELIS